MSSWRLDLAHFLKRDRSNSRPLEPRLSWSCVVRGNQVFRERFSATTDGLTSTKDSFPNDDFFPGMSSLYLNDMANDADANLNVNPTIAPYKIFSYLFHILLQLFVLVVFGIDVISLSWLDAICSSILLVCMIRLIPVIISCFIFYYFGLILIIENCLYIQQISTSKT
jgi:hypothetical protein